MRIVQLSHPSRGRKTAVVQGETLRLLHTCESTYSCVLTALIRGTSLEETIESLEGDETLVYAPVYAGESDWKLLPPLDHPEEPARCFVGGTGLTHSKGAKNRDAICTDVPICKIIGGIVAFDCEDRVRVIPIA